MKFPRVSRRNALSRRWSSVLLSISLFALSACSSSDEVDCGKLADHEARLLVEMLPEDMRARATGRVGEQRDAIEAGCERETPTLAVARCQLAAHDIRSHRECLNPKAEE